MSLYQDLSTPTKTRTMLAYRVKYWPLTELSQAGRELLVSNKVCYISKQELLTRLSEHKVSYFHAGHWYKLVWAYNNVPTIFEWERFESQGLLRLELRVSPAIEGARVAILAFDSMSAVKQPSPRELTVLHSLPTK